MLGIDVGFVLAVAAVGFGVSLASYRLFAALYVWPMGSWQSRWPPIPILLGVACTGLGVLFALARAYGGHAASAWAIPLFGIAWAIFWTGFLRVGAQSALLFGPLAATLLIMWWLN